MKTVSEKKILNIADGSERQYSVSHFYRMKNATVHYTYSAGKTVCQSDYYCHFYEPSHYCLMYFISGKGSLRHGSEKFSPKGSDLFILHQGVEWEYETDPDDPWQLIWININTDFFRPLLEFYGLGETVRLEASNVHPILEKIFQILENKDGTVFERRDAVTREIFHIIRDLSRLVLFPKSDSKQEDDARRMKEYIDDHITDDLRVSEISHTVFRSEGDATTIFRRFYNTPIKRYILEAKLRIAAQHLAETRLSVSEISSMLSFCDAQHFSRTFREFYNASPLQYRKAAQKNKADDPRS